MSAKAMGRVWDLDLPHNKRLVLLAMADHANHLGGDIYPSVALVAWKTGYSDRQVQRVIQSLVSDGILVIVAPATAHCPHHYRLDFDAGNEKEPFEGRQNVTSKGRQNVTPEPAPEPKRGDILSHPGVTFDASRGDTTMSPKPTEPSMNHVGVGVGGRTLAFLIDHGVNAAEEFAQLPYDSMCADYEARRADGQNNGSIVRAWRHNPPTEEYHYERSGSVQSRSASDNTRRSATRPKGSHAPTGGAELRDPGWMDREIARAEARAKGEL